MSSSAGPSSDAAGSASSSSSSSASAVGKQIPPHLRWRWSPKVYALPVVSFIMVYATFKAVLYINDTAKDTHDILPVYDESGKLKGFTHPTLVDAADSLREKKQLEAAAASVAGSKKP